jgi:hypothetical protein
MFVPALGTITFPIPTVTGREVKLTMTMALDLARVKQDTAAFVALPGLRKGSFGYTFSAFSTCISQVWWNVEAPVSDDRALVRTV